MRLIRIDFESDVDDLGVRERAGGEEVALVGGDQGGEGRDVSDGDVVQVDVDLSKIGEEISKSNGNCSELGETEQEDLRRAYQEGGRWCGRQAEPSSPKSKPAWRSPR